MSKIHDMIKKDAIEKEPIVHVQVAVPFALYESVKRLIADGGLTWQKMLIASIKTFEAEAATIKSKKVKKA